MNKNIFDDAIGEVPPSSIDLDAVITRGRRAARIRRVANPVVAAGIAVVVASGAVAFTMMQGDGESTRVGGQPTTTATTTAPPGSSKTPAPGTSTSPPGTATEVPEAKAPEGCASPDLETVAEVTSRLEPAAKAAVQAQRPDLQLLPNPEAQGPGALQFVQELDRQGNPRQLCDRFSGMVARASTQGPEGGGNIAVVVAPAFFASPDNTATCEETLALGWPYCEMATGPNGEVIMKMTSPAENGIITKSVDVVRPDGTLVRVASGNVSTSVKSGDDPSSVINPLTHEQMIAIAIDPTLTLFP